MYTLASLSDLIRVPPHLFNRHIHVVLRDELHHKYANKIITNLGLAVTLWDILKINDGLLKPGDGGSYIEVSFRLVVWKPFVGEILTGWVSDCSSDGIRVHMKFFNEIFIPKAYLFETCVFRPAEKAWVWKPVEDTELFIDIKEKIRFRVEEEAFVSVKPKSSSEALGLDEATNKAPAYALIASCQTDGMGCVSWWE
ncbi:hypothetical protein METBISCDRAFT_16131 [Metschnikowia bicuspidata]|uniref:DNA-directed RNA polymerase subunit n=1 Tax=Metschnikowia bicuspidata TaxID=27322 RepID=A0A4P9ZCC4_9ASCO|nr:hypothetical protein METBISCDRAFT_16131 [Metschnikowia bicuspidata]